MHRMRGVCLSHFFVVSGKIAFNFVAVALFNAKPWCIAGILHAAAV